MSSTKNADTETYTFSALLSALDGVAYIVRSDGVILHVGEPHWSDCAKGHASPGPLGVAVVNRSLFDAIADSKSRNVQERMHRQVIDGKSPLVSYVYRCDRADMLRRMRMAITPLTGRDETVAALYQSTILEETLRPPMTIFERIGAPDGALLTLCSYCHDVTWPAGEPATDAAWIEPEEYYRRGGSSEVVLSHGICPDCFTDLSLKITH